MDTPKPGWTPYVVYTIEILSFLHNRLFQTVKEVLKVKLVYASNAGHLLHSSRGPADKNDIFLTYFRKLVKATNDSQPFINQCLGLNSIDQC